jgi:N-acyl-D-amino-acid deacylase
VVPHAIARRVLTALVAAALGCRSPAHRTILFTNVHVIDGTGTPARAASLRIAGDTIAALGDLTRERSDSVVDGGGLTLAPGFIDTHSHADRGLGAHPDALAAVSQGITTVVGGQDGGSPYPLAPFLDSLERHPAALNLAMYVGHATLREQVLGPDYRRAATAAELDSMQWLLRRELGAGALGLSTGLEYEEAHSAAPSEVLALARVAADSGGGYISHLRSEDRGFWPAIEELLTIGRSNRMPVQLSHAKLAMRRLWGQADSLLRRLDAARAEGVDVTLDVYPYLYWQSTLRVLFPEGNYRDLREARFVLDQVAPAEGLRLSRFDADPGYVGKTVAEVAALRKRDPAATLIALIRESEGKAESVIGTSMVEPDLVRLLAWPFANICTDGELAGRHPRGYGSFPRVLGRYVREQRVVPLSEMIRKMTSLAAHNTRLTRRGELRPGWYADLVLFDPATVRDQATLAEPRALSTGIVGTWVNGVQVYRDGASTVARPGRVLRRTPAPTQASAALPHGRTAAPVAAALPHRRTAAP